MAKNKKKNTSVKEVEVIEEIENEEELEEVEENAYDFVEEEEEFEDGSSDYEEIGLEERLTNIEKKVNTMFYLVIAVLVVAVITLFISAGNNGSSQSNSSSESESSQSSTQQNSGYDTSAFNQIKPDDIATLSKNKTIVVWVGYQECGYCQAYAPVMTQVTKDFGITANYIDISTITQDEWNVVLNLKGKGDWKDVSSKFEGTPFTIIVKNGTVIGGISGSTTAEGLEAVFEDAGLKK